MAHPEQATEQTEHRSQSAVLSNTIPNSPNRALSQSGSTVRSRYHGTSLTAHQWEVIRFRSQGLTQTDVARKLGTTRENVSIIEHRALRKINAAKATLAALQHMDATNLILIPSGTSLYEAIEIVILRADILGVKLRSSCDAMISAFKSRCKGKIRGHHLVSVVRVEIGSDGCLTINPESR